MSSHPYQGKTFSFEFFPPRSDTGTLKLQATLERLSTLHPRFFSVTFGAGGSTRENTLETVLHIQQQGQEAAPHLSCIGSSRDQVHEILLRYRSHGIRRIVALRGDIPSGMRNIGDFSYASQLVEFIREKTGHHFHLEVAAYPEFHPEARSARDDLQAFRRKVEAGADSAITQYFYNVDAFYRFTEDCQSLGIDIPIVPGIMPITNFQQLARFSDNCGAEIPRWLRKRLEGFGDDLDSIRDYGAEVVSKLCRDLLENGAPGIHVYTMNQAQATLRIWKNLGLAGDGA